jgi:signal transduction histidine kinase
MGLRLALLASLAAVALAPIAVLAWASRPLVEEVRQARIDEFGSVARSSFGLFESLAEQVAYEVRSFQQGVGQQNLKLSRLNREDGWWGRKRDLARLRAALERIARDAALEAIVVRSGAETIWSWPPPAQVEPSVQARSPGLAPGWRWDPDEDLVRYMHALPLDVAPGEPPLSVAGWRSWRREELSAELRDRLGDPEGVLVELRGRLPGSLPLRSELGKLVRELPSPRRQATVAAVIDARGLEVPVAGRLRRALLTVAVLGGIAAALLTLVLSRTLSRPLSRLTAAVDEVADGQPPEGGMPSGPGEIGQLASAVDRMLAREQRERTERRRAERTAAWQEVARRVAHEIRNPLTPIRLAVDNLTRASHREEDALRRSLPEETAAILEEVERLDRLVREFSEFARLPRPHPAPADLVELARRAVEGQLPDPETADVRLDVQAPDHPLRASVDADLLTLAIANLAANAVRALGADGGTLRLTVATERSASGTPRATIALEDDGPGIPEELRESLFEPYVSGRVGENVGLGLATVRQIVAEHGGDVDARNRDEGGACLSLRLPLPGPSAADTPTPKEQRR